jgi:hypothetical protein
VRLYSGEPLVKKIKATTRLYRWSVFKKEKIDTDGKFPAF